MDDSRSCDGDTVVVADAAADGSLAAAGCHTLDWDGRRSHRPGYFGSSLEKVWLSPQWHFRPT